MTVENTCTVSQAVEQATGQHLVVPTGQWRGRTITLLTLLLVAAANQVRAEDGDDPSTAAKAFGLVIGFLFLEGICLSCSYAIEQDPIGRDLNRFFAGRLLG